MLRLLRIYLVSVFQLHWDRKVLETSLSSIVGSVSSEKAGLPAEEADAYIKKGYSLNDRVGTSYLEKQYEETLQGKRSVKEIHLDKHGNMESVENIEDGTKGNNIKLTIDLSFQDSVDNLLKSYFNSELGNGGAKYSEGVYAVALNPKTGAVLSMSGLKHDLKTGELTPDSLGTVTNVFVPGSVVKGGNHQFWVGEWSLIREPDLDRSTDCLPRFISN